jgi:hypothetical protein
MKYRTDAGVMSAASLRCDPMVNSPMVSSKLKVCRFAAGGEPIMDPARDATGGLEALCEKGADGTLTFWFDFDEDTARFSEGAMPPVKARDSAPPSCRQQFGRPAFGCIGPEYNRVTDSLSVPANFKDLCVAR